MSKRDEQSSINQNDRCAVIRAEEPIRKPRARLRRLIARFLLAGLSLFVALVVAELALRILAPLDARGRASWYEAHPIYQFRHRPHLDQEFLYGQPYWIRTNARGLREDEDIPYESRS